jgi:transcriptional regulator with XRE-family HTH domain
MPNTPLARLRQERERRGWSRNYVAEHIQVDVVTVGRWERGERLPHPVYRQRLCALFEMNAEQLGLFVEPFQEQHGDVIDLNCSPLQDGFSDDDHPQADVDAADVPDTMHERAGSSPSTLPSQEETPSRNTWGSSRLAHVSKRGRLVILTMGLLAVVTVFGALSLTPLTHEERSVHLLYTNGTILNKDCAFGNEGPIVAPHKVSNDCIVRVWLYTQDHRTGRTLCLDPGTTTGMLHTAWVYFWVSKNPSVCSSSNVGTMLFSTLEYERILLLYAIRLQRAPSMLAQFPPL